MKQTLGDQEMEVLDFILGKGPVTVRETSEHFADASGLARTTVQTVMERLRKKGFLERENEGGVFLYRAAVQRRALLDKLIGDFIKNKLGGSVSPFVAFLAEGNKLSEEEIEQLQQIARRLEDEGK
jgi:predicted transcriptional regulator